MPVTDLTQVLVILERVQAIVAALNEMGVKVTGTIDLPTILKILGVTH